MATAITTMELYAKNPNSHTDSPPPPTAPALILFVISSSRPVYGSCPAPQPPAATPHLHGEGGSDPDGMTACTRIPLGDFSRFLGRELLEAQTTAKGRMGGGGGKKDGEVEVAVVVARAGAPYWRQQFPPNVWGGKKLHPLP